MVEVRASRLIAEVVADEGTVAAANRLDVQALALGDGTDEVQSSRLIVEVLAAETPMSAASRLDVQALALGDGADEVQVSRMIVEVLGGEDAMSAVSRLDVQALALGGGTDEVQVSRMIVECLARQGSAGPVTALPLADDSYIFLHNWATKAKITTSFRNDVVASPDSGAESRRGLGVKPTRSVELEWTICDANTASGVGSLVELERLEVLLRRMTNERVQVPIYPDQQELSTSYLASASTILVNTSQGRFFPGQRVAIVQLDACNQPTSHSFHIIEDMTNSQLTFDASLGVDVAAGSYVFPLMDCEVVLEAEADYSTARVPSVKLTMIEAPGASQLPPIKSDTPAGAEVFEERPVWYEEPDWTRGISKGRSRQGRRTSAGRADFVNLEGDRSRQTHRFYVSGDRTAMWNALEFFETRRGRLRSFWHVDQDQYFELVAIDAGGASVGISENDLDLADTQEEFDHLGLVMADGTVYVREVSNIMAILTVFNVALLTPLPAGLQVADVHRVARARLTRFTRDEFEETWTHTGYCQARVEFIEVLNEQNYSI